MSLTNNGTYFNGLNGIRAIASLTVVIGHTIQFSRYFGLDNYSDFAQKAAILFSGLAVTSFFVLSGFLITYLLIQEKVRTKQINIKQFYLRRILRIWPLYYFILIIAFILLPIFGLIKYDNIFTSVLLYGTLFANVALVFNFSSPFLAPLWSISVEEQFYIFWPHLFKKHNLTFKVILIGLLYFILKVSIHAANKLFLEIPEQFLQLIDSTRFDSMAIGGLAAIVLLKSSFTKKQVLVFALIGFIGTILSLKYAHLFHHEFYSILIASIILILTTKNSKTWLDNPFINRLGKISYGIYMYHMIVIVFISGPLVDKLDINYLIISVIITIIITVVISFISFELFEKKLIQIKKSL